MKDEIKEILEQLKIRNDLYNDRDESCIVPIEYYEAHILLDYITNLQEKLDFIIDRNDEKQDRIDKAIEFIDKYCIDDEFYINLTYKEKAILEVKKILQGSDK